jgi:hypothetical protein
MPIVDIQPRPTEIGRIRTGEKTDRGLPKRLDHFRLTSQSQAAIARAAELYGGEPTVWSDAPDPGTYELRTETAALPIVIPTSLETVSQWYELWESGVEAVRRCDGVTEQISGSPCFCTAGERECSPKTRVSVMLPDLPGLGVWRLDSGGYIAAASIPSTIELLARLTRDPWVEATLRLVQRSTKARTADGKTERHPFCVPVFDVRDRTLSELVSGANADRLEIAERQEVAEDAPTRMTARERAAERAAQITAGDGEAAPRPAVSEAASGSEDTSASDEPPLPEPPTTSSSSGSVTVPPDAVETTETAASAEAVPVAGPPEAEPEKPATEPEACGEFLGQMGPCFKRARHRGKHAAKNGEWTP